MEENGWRNQYIKLLPKDAKVTTYESVRRRQLDLPDETLSKNFCAGICIRQTGGCDQFYACRHLRKRVVHNQGLPNG